MKNFQFNLMKKVGLSINKYSLIKDKDTVVVALSGGKDSYALLDILHTRLKHLPIKYNLIGLHVDFGYNKKEVEEIKKFCAKRDIPCHIESKKLPKGNKQEPNCFWCSWNRRKIIFDFMKDNGYKKLAFGHHADDAIETLFLNMFYQSKFESFYPKTIFFKGTLEVIRPLINCTNNEIETYSKLQKFKTSHHKCPFNIKSERIHIRQILKKLTKDNVSISYNILTSWLKKT
jgi:tRNA 2-thiocytidine biosynthesis protein TtcA